MRRQPEKIRRAVEGEKRRGCRRLRVHSMLLRKKEQEDGDVTANRTYATFRKSKDGQAITGSSDAVNLNGNIFCMQLREGSVSVPDVWHTAVSTDAIERAGQKPPEGIGVVMTCLVVVLNDSKRTFRFEKTISTPERKKLSNLNICPFYAGYKTYQCVWDNRIKI